MARKGCIKGMAINLSSSPPKCDHCVLGKQTHSSVPKVQEGTRASSPLEQIHVDLCGPMPVLSKTGHHFSMNIIDDFSGYVWSLPLKAKSDAASTLITWHRAVENQTGQKLKILITDNGKLIS